MTKNVLNKLGFLGAVFVAAVGLASIFCIKRIGSVAGSGRSRTGRACGRPSCLRLRWSASS